MGKLEKLIEKSDRGQRWSAMMEKDGAFEEAVTAFLKSKTQEIAQLGPGDAGHFEFLAAQRDGVLAFRRFVELAIDEGNTAALEIKTGRPQVKSGRIAK